jgi:phosphotransferase system enzyme I (PtsI)
MYPMVADAAQFLELRAAFNEACADEPVGEIRHGVMFEVPSACLSAREILDVADFGSIGSNDLVQYLFAVDRNNALVARDYTPHHPVLWSLLDAIGQAAQATGKPVGICGELAADPVSVPWVIACGFTEVSVSPRCIPAVRTKAAEVLRSRAAAVGQGARAEAAEELLEVQTKGRKSR